MHVEMVGSAQPTPLVAHSLAEAYLYLLATPCPSCDRGPLEGGDAHRLDSPDSNLSHGGQCPPQVLIDAICAACGETTSYTFGLPHGLAADEPDKGAVVNPADAPSRIIDVAQWITLFRTITEAAGQEADKIQARHLGLEAAQCLEEALKFYDEVGNDLPPPEALFHEASRKRLKENPQQFSKERLINLRSKLPTLAVMRSRLKARPKRRWWRLRR